MIDSGEVDRNLRQTSVRLLTQDHNFFAIAGLQDAAGFGDGFADGKTTRHQSDSRLAYVPDHAVAIRSGLIERNGNLRTDDVFVVALLDQFSNLIDGLAVDKDAVGNQRQGNASTRRNLNALLRVPILAEYVDGDYVLGPEP